jgi:hypothetical protein
MQTTVYDYESVVDRVLREKENREASAAKRSAQACSHRPQNYRMPGEACLLNTPPQAHSCMWYTVFDDAESEFSTPESISATVQKIETKRHFGEKD